MNLVRFKVTVRTADGTRVPLASGMVRATPSQLIVVPGDPDEMVPKTEVWRNLVDGYTELTLDAPTASWCWWIRVFNAQGRDIASGYYTFTESVDPLDFPRDLIEVDPSTLQPAHSAVPAWEAAVSAVEGYAQAAAEAVDQVGETIAAEVQDWLDANPPTAGDDGREVEFGLSATHVQWRYVGDVAWTDLIALSSLVGATGATPELQVTATHLQWRLVGGAWANLIALTELKGVQGDAGPSVELQKSATHVQWRVSGTLPWADLVPLADLKGVKGDKGDTPPTPEVTDLGVGTVADGEMLVRSGSALVGAPIPSGGGGSLSGEGQPTGTAPIGTVYADTLATAGAQVWVYTGTTWEVLIGDTGWRQLGALAVPPFDKDWTSLQLRRVGSQVYLQEASTYMLNNGAAQSNAPTHVLTFPSVFQSAVSVHLETNVSGITFQLGGAWFSGVVPSNMTDLRAKSSIVVWPASHPWPATLPGEAAE